MNTFRFFLIIGFGFFISGCGKEEKMQVPPELVQSDNELLQDPVVAEKRSRLASKDWVCSEGSGDTIQFVTNKGILSIKGGKVGGVPMSGRVYAEEIDSFVGMIDQPGKTYELRIGPKIGPDSFEAELRSEEGLQVRRTFVPE